MAHFLPLELVRQVIKLEWPKRLLITNIITNRSRPRILRSQPFVNARVVCGSQLGHEKNVSHGVILDGNYPSTLHLLFVVGCK